MNSRHPAPIIDLSSLPSTVDRATLISLDQFAIDAESGAGVHLLNGLTDPGGEPITVRGIAEDVARIDQELQGAFEDIQRTMQVLNEVRGQVARQLGLLGPEPPSAYHNYTRRDGLTIGLMARNEFQGNGAVERLHERQSFLAMHGLPLFGFGCGTDEDELSEVRRRNRTCLDDAVLRGLLS